MLMRPLLANNAGCDVANIATWDITVCYNECAANPNCKFFVFGAGMCWWVAGAQDTSPDQLS
jgi:hypothetical protein